MYQRQKELQNRKHLISHLQNVISFRYNDDVLSINSTTLENFRWNEQQKQLPLPHFLTFI